MENLDELIYYGRESDHLDFKEKQYNKEKVIDLLKDLLAMANGAYEGDKYIIIGVRQEGADRFIPLGITDDLVDASSYQQTVHEYIEPDINFEYFAHEVDNKKFGIFRIKGNNNRPYMTKKSYSKLPEGFANIRKGTFQPILLRPDLDLIQDRKASMSKFDGKVQVLPYPSNASRFELKTVKLMSLPSQQEAHLIEYYIYRKKNVDAKPPHLYEKRLIDGIDHYSHLELKELEESLRKVKTTYLGEDLYSKYEEHASKMNFQVKNTGNIYLIDAQIRLQIPALNGIDIVDKIHNKPNYVGYSFIGRVEKPEKPLYPTVIRAEGKYIIDQKMGDIKHYQDTLLFVNPIRVWASPSLIGTNFEVQVTIFGENLPTPINQTIVVHLV
jgi:Putative DNA-binding domain